LSSEDEMLKEAQGISRYAVGDDRFVAEVEEELDEAKRSVAVDGDIHWPEQPQVSLERIVAAVSKVCKVPESVLLSRSRRHITPRRLAIELACLYSGQSQRELAAAFGYGCEGSIGKQRQALAGHLKEDGEPAKLLAKARAMVLDSSFQV
jgi:hypothetical protein